MRFVTGRQLSPHWAETETVDPAFLENSWRKANTVYMSAFLMERLVMAVFDTLIHLVFLIRAFTL